MALRLLYRYRETVPPYKPFVRSRDLDAHPCLTITASGIGPSSADQTLIDFDGGPMPPTDPSKPPYKVPLLAEIRERPWNGLNAISTFCGAGGSSTGYRMAGYRILAAVEFVPLAQETYEANMADYTRLVRKDVRDVTGAELLQAANQANLDAWDTAAAPRIGVGDLDLFDGSPPCEPFSSAGKRDQTWRQEVAYSGQRQRTDDLFLEYARLVDEIRPKAFVAENVEGLVRGRAKGYFKIILKELRSLGYRVEARVLDAQWLGTPQVRKRLIFVGVREDLGKDPVFPRPLAYNYTVREAIEDLLQGGRVVHDTQGQFGRKGDVTDEVSPAVLSSGSGNFKVEKFTRETGGANQAAEPHDFLDEPSPTITGDGRNAGHYQLEGVERRLGGSAEHGRRTPGSPDEPASTVVAKGGTEGDTTNGHFVEITEQIVGNEAFEPVFGSLEQPSPTIMAGGARTSGELAGQDPGGRRVRRKMTIPEVMRIAGFPDDYRLAGSFSKKWERLGDSVAPQMAEAVGSAIRDKILED